MPALSNDELLLEIRANNGCAGLDLSGLDFELIADDAILTFENCTISETQIRGDALAASTWSGCKFLGSRFVGACLKDARFEKCDFFDAEHTTGAELRFCDLTRAKFTDCNLSLAKFVRCDCYEIAFADCLMRGVSFEATPFSQEIGRRHFNKATFERCRMPDAVLTKLDLGSSEFRDCSLVDANLSETSFANAVLVECDLMYSDVYNADFSGADLRSSSLDGFSLIEVKSYVSLMISASQQHHLLSSIGVEVFPDEA